MIASSLVFKMADEEKKNGVEDSHDLNSDGSDDGEWEEAMEDDAEPVKCLFCDDCFSGGAANVLQHCEAIHRFSFSEIKHKYGLDSYGCIKLVNYIRKKAPSPDTFSTLRFPLPWESEEFLKPEISNDGLLHFDFDENSDEDETPEEKDHFWPSDMATVPHSQYVQLLQRLQVSEERASQAEAGLAKAVEDIHRLRAVAQDAMLGEGSICSVCSGARGSQSRGPTHQRDTDSGYFTSYAQFDIHEEMLKDKTRTESYRDFIYGNPSIFKGKIVLDIGCGTGILSMFAARAGARHVIGIDQSDIIYQAMDIVRENGLEKKITLIKGKAETVELPVDKIDVIISEWMGYFLLFESMLDTVLFARDKWLTSVGSVFPNKCSVIVAAMSDSSKQRDKLNYWDDVYGFKMSCMKTSLFKEPTVEIVDPAVVLSNTCVLKNIDISSCRVEDLDFTSSFCLEAIRDDLCTALVTYFDIYLGNGCEKEVYFSTGPSDHPTHWKQTVFYFDKPFGVSKGQILKGTLSCRKHSKDPRSLDVSLEIISSADGSIAAKQDYVME